MSDRAIRESYRVFPGWTQHFWTWLTGKPLAGQTPLFRHTPGSFLVAALMTFSAGIALGALGAAVGSPWGLLALLSGWCLTVNASRRLISTVVHQCIHNRFSAQRRWNMLLAEFLTLLVLTPNAREYQREHFGQHHRIGTFTTARDPSAIFLMDAGFRPGLTPRAYWRVLLANCLSPAFHGRFLLKRLHSNLVSATPMRRLGALLYLAAWSAPVFLLDGGAWVVLLAFLVPIVPLYQSSVLLEFISEHAWLVPIDEADARTKKFHGTHSWGRFCGSPLPDPSLPSYRRALAWTTWLGATLLYHLPVRLMILPGDLPQHDFHHRNPNTQHWTAAAYARQSDSDRAADGRPPYAEFWGIHRAIEHVFRGLQASARPDRRRGAVAEDDRRVA